MNANCIVGAVSKMQKPVSDKCKKNDHEDVELLVLQLLAYNIVEVFVRL